MPNLSWLNESTPAPPERDSRRVFEKLFGSGDPKDDAKRLQARVGATDRGKMDECLTAVRDIEVCIEQAGEFDLACPQEQRPGGIPENYEEHIRIQFELMALAFQSDTTRVSTFMLAHDGSDRAFPELNIQSGHHQLSHHRNSKASLDNLAAIDRFYAEQFAWFIERLRHIQEGEGNLLERSMIVYGGGMADGNRHDHANIPLLLAGYGNGQLRPGRFIEAAEGSPLTNLHLSLLERLGVSADRIGDSSGTLEQI